MMLRVLGMIVAACLAFAGVGAAQQGKTELLWYGQSAFKITTRAAR